MHPKYLLFLPLWLVSASPIEGQNSDSIAIRGDDDGCPWAHGGCQGKCISRNGDTDVCRTWAGDRIWDFPCGAPKGTQTGCGGLSQLACTAFRDAETICPGVA